MANMEEEKGPTVPDLPPEMLEKVLEKLVDGQNSVLLFRLVNSEWKAIIDSLLEKASLAELTKWIPDTPETPDPRLQGSPTLSVLEDASIPGQNLNANELANQPQFVRCPTPILEHKGNPFPSNSLCIATVTTDGNGTDSPRIELQTFMPKFGHYLTSLVLRGLSVKPNTLFGILNHTKNLKALRLVHMFVAPDDDSTLSRPLPALPDLTFLFLSFNKYLYWLAGIVRFLEEVQAVEQWFLDSYANQLTHLDVDLHNYGLHTIGRATGELRASFGKLEKLELRHPRRPFLRQCHVAPLKRLSMHGPCPGWGGNIYDVTNFIDKFVPTLEHLYMYMGWNAMIHVKKGQIASDFQQLKFSEAVGNIEPRKMKGILPTSKVVFPRLKKLAMEFPHWIFPKILLRRTFLPKFPELEKLQFLWYLDEDTPSYSVEGRYLTQEDVLRKLLAQEDYWRLCPKLQVISVVSLGDVDEEVIRLQRPN